MAFVPALPVIKITITRGRCNARFVWQKSKERTRALPVLVLFLAATVVLADQLIKLLVLYALKPLGTVTVIPGLFNLTYVENRGAAFGMLEGHRWFLIAMVVLITAIFVFILCRFQITSKLFASAVVLILGGGISNLIDRLAYGFVVDYLSVSFFPPVCNLADYCITVGTVLLVIYILFFSDLTQKEREAKAQNKESRSGQDKS